MRKLLTVLTVSALVATAGCAATSSSADGTTPSRSYYYWLHPKLGMVKADRVTHMMITGQRRVADGADTGSGTQPAR